MHGEHPPRPLLANLYRARAYVYAHDDRAQYLLLAGRARLLGRRVDPAERDEREEREAECLTLKLLHDPFSFTRKIPRLVVRYISCYKTGSNLPAFDGRFSRLNS